MWLFLATLWVVCVFAVVAFTGEFGKKWHELGRAKSWDKIILRIEEGIKAGGLTNNDGVFVDVETLRSDLVEVKNKIPEIVKESEEAASWFYGLLGFLLGPTVGLLFLGRAGIWVAEGFRANAE